MNPKALLFDKFLKDEEITSFERKDFDDEDGTVVYRSYIKSPLWDMPLFVILDNSIYSVIPVSYTHLDVYKRQAMCHDTSCSSITI